VASREKDLVSTRELARRGVVSKDPLLSLLAETDVTEEVRARIGARIAADFTPAGGD
jgi:hypothetical protein